MQRTLEARSEIIYEVDRLGNALRQAEGQLLAKSAVIGSLQEAVEAKNETIVTLKELLEPYEDKDRALREDVLRVEMARSKAERLYLAAEKDARMSPSTRTQGAQELFDALRDIQTALRDMGRRVGVSIDPAPEAAAGVGEGGDTDMPAAASTEPGRGMTAP